MLEIDSIVRAVVVRVEPFGVFMKHTNDDVFVPLNNVSWHPTPDTLSKIDKGQELAVYIERLNYKEGVYAGSLKRTRPDDNPYRHLSRQPPETVFCGRVVFVHHDGIRVELENGCRGELPIAEDTKALTQGTEVRVQLTSLEVNDQSATFKLAG